MSPKAPPKRPRTAPPRAPEPAPEREPAPAPERAPEREPAPAPGRPPQADPPPAVAPLPRAALLALGLAAAVVGLAGIHQARGILGPLFLAVVLVLTLDPIRVWARRRGAHEWVGASALLVAALAILVGLVASLALSVSQLAVLLPRYSGRLEDVAVQVGGVLAPLGVETAQVTGFVRSLDLTDFAGELRPMFGTATSAVSGLLLVVILVLFLGFEDATFVRRFERAPLPPDLFAALRAFVDRTRRYVVVSTAFGLVVAAIDVVVLYLLGVPAPLVWGLLAFVTNYIPNVGFVIGLAPPAAILFLQAGLGPFVFLVVAYSVINFVAQSIVQPKVVGDAVGLSGTVTLLSLVFWAFVMGPLGGLLAVPLTLLAKAIVVDANPSRRWVGELLGDEVKGTSGR